MRLIAACKRHNPAPVVLVFFAALLLKGKVLFGGHEVVGLRRHRGLRIWIAVCL